MRERHQFGICGKRKNNQLWGCNSDCTLVLFFSLKKQKRKERKKAKTNKQYICHSLVVTYGMFTALLICQEILGRVFTLGFKLCLERLDHKWTALHTSVGHLFCSVNVSAPWCVPDKHITGKVDVGSDEI